MSTSHRFWCDFVELIVTRSVSDSTFQEFCLIYKEQEFIKDQDVSAEEKEMEELRAQGGEALD